LSLLPPIYVATSNMSGKVSQRESAGHAAALYAAIAAMN
jgi:hypothetical protein